jgi:Methyltransferase domain
MYAAETNELFNKPTEDELHTPRFKNPTLDDVLAYEHEDLIARFMEDHHVSESYARELFIETKKWLWLCHMDFLEHAKTSPTIYPFMGALDEMWHSFVLFSKDYETFCHDFFGRFIHHYPTPVREKAQHNTRLHEDQEGLKVELHEKLLAFVGFVEKKLGKETAVKWFGPEERLSTGFLKRAAGHHHNGEYWEDRLTGRLPSWAKSSNIEYDTLGMSDLVRGGEVRRALIVGFANFSDALALASKGIKVVGVDVSAAGVETYRRAAETLSLAPKILGVVADIRSADLSELGEFNLITCTMMLHVLEPSERAEAVRKLAAAASKDSLILVSALSDEDRYLHQPSEGVALEELKGLFERENFVPESLHVKYIAAPHSHPGGAQHAGHHIIQGTFRRRAE